MRSRVKKLEFIEDQKKKYKKLRPCNCPAINETVHFNSKGLNHLLYDNKHRPRNIDERVYKIALVDYLSEVISIAKAATVQSYSTPPSELWVLSWVRIKKINSKGYYIVKVILRREGDGNVHFLSVMRKPTKKRQSKNT